MLREKVKQMDIEFLVSGGHKIDPDKFIELWSKGEAILLDVRLEEEAQLCKLGFGINIPLHKLPENLDKIPRDKLVVTVCLEKVRASIAFSYLLSEGFENVKVLGATLSELVSKIKPGLVKKLK